MTSVIMPILSIVLCAILGFFIRSIQAIFIKKNIIKLGELLSLSYAREHKKPFYIINYGFLVGTFNDRIVEIRGIEPKGQKGIYYSIQISTDHANINMTISKKTIINRPRISTYPSFDSYYRVYGQNKRVIQPMITTQLERLLLKNYANPWTKIELEDNFLKIVGIGKWNDLPTTMHNDIALGLEVATEIEKIGFRDRG